MLSDDCPNEGSLRHSLAKSCTSGPNTKEFKRSLTARTPNLQLVETHEFGWLVLPLCVVLGLFVKRFMSIRGVVVRVTDSETLAQN